MRAATVSLGLVGVGDERFPQVMRCVQRQKRLSLRDVYDPCLILAERRASEHSATFSASLKRLLHRVEGVVVLNLGWMGSELLLRAATTRRPTLILRRALETLTDEQWRELSPRVWRSETLLMPELAWRWSRAVLRLRELTATRLGAIESLTVRADIRNSGLGLLEVVDLCQYLVQSDYRSAESDAAGERLTLTFRRVNRDDTPVRAIIEQAAAPAPGAAPRISALCRHGRVELLDESTLEWATGRPVEKESLSGERSPEELMYDLFGRRLVGGVVPVPDLYDVIRARQVAAALAASRRAGREVDVEPNR